MGNYGAALGALVVSLATLAMTALSLRHKASTDRCDSLDEKIKELERHLDECEAGRRLLMSENVELMRRLVQIERKGDKP